MFLFGGLSEIGPSTTFEQGHAVCKIDLDTLKQLRDSLSRKLKVFYDTVFPEDPQSYPVHLPLLKVSLSDMVVTIIVIFYLHYTYDPNIL